MTDNELKKLAEFLGLKAKKVKPWISMNVEVEMWSGAAMPTLRELKDIPKWLESPEGQSALMDTALKQWDELYFGRRTGGTGFLVSITGNPNKADDYVEIEADTRPKALIAAVLEMLGGEG